MEADLDLARETLGFSAAHFAVIGDRSERLHGHNYRVALRVHGRVDEEGAVVDFGALKSSLRELCRTLDERMLVATRSARVTVDEHGDSVLLTEGTRRFSLPRSDVVLLPILNTTCECLAAHLLAELRARLGHTAYRLALRVEEVPGQGAWVSE